MMHFTRSRDEKHKGLEFCCDTCARRADSYARAMTIWWYVRYNIFDEHPSMWICNKCKQEMDDFEGKEEME